MRLASWGARRPDAINLQGRTGLSSRLPLYSMQPKLLREEQAAADGAQRICMAASLHDCSACRKPPPAMSAIVCSQFGHLAGGIAADARPAAHVRCSLNSPARNIICCSKLRPVCYRIPLRQQGGDCISKMIHGNNFVTFLLQCKNASKLPT